MKKIDQHADHAYALLRIVAGALFLFHGAQKLFGVFGAAQPPFGSQLWFAGVIEFVGGLLIMLGLGARIAAFVASGEMAVEMLMDIHENVRVGVAERSQIEGGFGARPIFQSCF